MARAGAGEIIASAATLEAAGLTVEGSEPVRLPGLAGTVAAAPVTWR
jgi:class 3 adenylate cyclase